MEKATQLAGGDNYIQAATGADKRMGTDTAPCIFACIDIHLHYCYKISINCIINIKCVICIISDPKSPGHT